MSGFKTNRSLGLRHRVSRLRSAARHASREADRSCRRCAVRSPATETASPANTQRRRLRFVRAASSVAVSAFRRTSVPVVMCAEQPSVAGGLEASDVARRLQTHVESIPSPATPVSRLRSAARHAHREANRSCRDCRDRSPATETASLRETPGAAGFEASVQNVLIVVLSRFSRTSNRPFGVRDACYDPPDQERLHMAS
jgi:hypothetical protein